MGKERTPQLEAVSGELPHVLMGHQQSPETLWSSETLFRSAIHAMQEGLVLQDCQGAILFCNENAARILGLTADQMMGRTSLDPRWHAIHPDGTDWPGETHPAMIALTRGIPQQNQVMGVHKPNGTLSWISINASPLFRPAMAEPYGVVTTFADITERKRFEEALQDTSQRLKIATESGAMGVWEYDIHTNALTWDERMLALYEYTAATFPGVYKGWRERVHPDDQERVERKLQEAIRGGKKFDVEFRIVIPQGGIKILKADAIVIRDKNSQRLRMIGLTYDITERKQQAQEVERARRQLERQLHIVNRQALELENRKTALEAANARLESLATTDGLTGIYNHRAFQDRLAADLERTLRYATPLSILLIDVDRFKTFNDTFGHPAGDRVLKTVAELLQETARVSDFVARYGGEEFVAILPETGTLGACEVAERLRMAIQSHPWSEQPITVSIGIATLRPQVDTQSALIDQADRALYQAKERGRNRVVHANDVYRNTTPQQVDAIGEALKQILATYDDTTNLTQQVRETLLSACDSIVDSLCQITQLKDKEAEGHCERVADLMVRLGRYVGMTGEEIRFARWGALLHNFGKIGIRDSILHKTEPLTEQEWGMMRRHPEMAQQMLNGVGLIHAASEIPYCHEERWDGTGYPRGLQGDEIPLAVRLFTVIDVYDTLKAERPYRKGWSEPQIKRYLSAESGTHFDPRAVAIFLKMLQEQEQETLQEQKPPLDAAADDFWSAVPYSEES